MYYHGRATMILNHEYEQEEEKAKIKMKISFMLYNPTMRPAYEFRK